LETSSSGEPRARTATIDPATREYTRLLNGPPETLTMRSGAVVLMPGQSVGRHSTEDYEEAIVTLSGRGELRLADGSSFAIRPYVLAYCPPDTVHEVVNTGTEPLRYVFLVARAR
jgi:quercetin dioxygenase-like cupin family protein